MPRVLQSISNMMRPDDTFIAYADGSSLRNPGPAGWAAVVITPERGQEWLTGFASRATNNVMEMTAVIETLLHLPDDSEGVIRTDSQYVVRGLTEWRKGWERRGFRNSQNKPVANPALWKGLFSLADLHPGVRYEWVRGHNGEAINEMVDDVARECATKQEQHSSSVNR